MAVAPIVRYMLPRDDRYLEEANDRRITVSGRYSVQFWYDGSMIEERPLQLR